MELDPDIVLLLFLPPLLFNAAYFTSLRDLRQNTRPIMLTSIGLAFMFGKPPTEAQREAFRNRKKKEPTS